MKKIDMFSFVSAICATALIASCATADPPLPQNSPADPQVRSSRTPTGLVLRDETTREIERVLSATEEDAKGAQSTPQEMHNMQGMQHDEMQHGNHAGMEHGAGQPQEKKALADEMKKTSDQMKAASDAMKKKSNEMKSEPAVYTCPMHPQVHSDKPGKCPICGMQLIKKKQ